MRRWKYKLNHTLRNVWYGVTVCAPDELSKLDDLRETPAAVRFVSFEPLLADMGQVDLSGIDWVICGGESGPGARPMHPDWVRSLRDQCAAASVPFFFKQWGDHPWPWCKTMVTAGWDVNAKKGGRVLDGREWNQYPEVGP
jgi:protein gp37